MLLLLIPAASAADCDAFVVIASSNLPAVERVALAGACRKAAPQFPPPDAGSLASEALELGFAELEAGDLANAAAIGTAVYTYGSAIATASLGEAELGLALRSRALDLVQATGAPPTELVALDDAWRFEPGPSAALVGEAALVRQMLAVRSLPRRDERACAAYAAWTEHLGRANLGLPHEVQLEAITRAVAEDPPEPRACAAGLRGIWSRHAAAAAEVRARVVALTRPR